MMPHFMVRVLRSGDDDYADVVVDAPERGIAEKLAVDIVIANPDQWFGPVEPPHYYFEEGSTEEVDPKEWKAANE